MKELLEFVFIDGPHFFGFCFLLIIMFCGVCAVVKAFTGGKPE